ncbi:MAG: ATP-dependent Clp protease adaptor ClpS [Chitinivibrionales bacterium]|nr:ATP-dependent Clp protease adaptor ClpS [Chitinivibrionales bacterium]
MNYRSRSNGRPTFICTKEQFKIDNDTDVLTKTQKNFKVVLFNDETHTYGYVVELLTATCNLTKEAAFRCAVEVDLAGRTIVYYGTHSQCLIVMNKIVNYGPDHRLLNSFTSMNAEVQEH